MKHHCKHCRLSFSSDAGFIDHQKNCKSEGSEAAPPKTTGVNNWVNYLTIALIILLFLNIVVMGVFSTSVNKKLGDALAETMPQKGVLTLILPSDCDLCATLDAQIQKLVNQNIELTDDLTFDAGMRPAKDLIDKYNIKTLPALIFEADGDIRNKIKTALKQDARVEGESVLIWEQDRAPYFDLSANDVRGLVSITFLTDNTCGECYDVKARQVSILSRMGLVFGSEKAYDISEPEGKELLDKYSITKLPTIILSTDVSVYPAVTEVWREVGSVEDDGKYVFRDLSVLMETYKDLETGRLIEPSQQ